MVREFEREELTMKRKKILKEVADLYKIEGSNRSHESAWFEFTHFLNMKCRE